MLVLLLFYYVFIKKLPGFSQSFLQAVELFPERSSTSVSTSPSCVILIVVSCFSLSLKPNMSQSLDKQRPMLYVRRIKTITKNKHARTRRHAVGIHLQFAKFICTRARAHVRGRTYLASDSGSVTQPWRRTRNDDVTRRPTITVTAPSLRNYVRLLHTGSWRPHARNRESFHTEIWAYKWVHFIRRHRRQLSGSFHA